MARIAGRDITASPSQLVARTNTLDMEDGLKATNLQNSKRLYFAAADQPTQAQAQTQHRHGRRFRSWQLVVGGDRGRAATDDLAGGECHRADGVAGAEVEILAVAAGSYARLYDVGGIQEGVNHAESRLVVGLTVSRQLDSSDQRVLIGVGKGRTPARARKGRGLCDASEQNHVLR